MKHNIGIITLSCMALFGCQSTATSTSAASPACEIGDDYNDKTATWDEYRQSLIACGGFDIFVEDMLVGTKVSRVNNSGKYRSYEFMDGGVGVHLGSGGDQKINWRLTQDGFVLVTFEDDWHMYWALLEEKPDAWAIKIYDRDAADTEQYIWSVNYTIESKAEE